MRTFELSRETNNEGVDDVPAGIFRKPAGGEFKPTRIDMLERLHLRRGQPCFGGFI
jgi:hypothetical protein